MMDGPEIAPAVAIPGTPRYYLLARRDRMGELEKIAAEKGASLKMEVLAESKNEGAIWTILQPMAKEEWFSARGWQEERSETKAVERGPRLDDAGSNEPDGQNSAS